MGRRPLERIPFTLSLRTQLVLVTSALIALAIVVTSLVAISALRAQMVHQLDDEMKANSANLLSLVSNNSQHPVQEATLGSYHVYLLDEHGNTLYALSPDTSSRDEPQVTGWTADKVRKNNGVGTTVNSVEGSKDWRLLPMTLNNDTSVNGCTPPPWWLPYPWSKPTRWLLS